MKGLFQTAVLKNPILVILLFCACNRDLNTTSSEEGALQRKTPLSHTAQAARVSDTPAIPILRNRLALGDRHSCAVRSDGTLFCWGMHQHGLLGAAARKKSSVPVRIGGLSNVIEVAAGDFHTCALQGNGAVLCWGDNRTGQTGTEAAGTLPEPSRILGQQKYIRLKSEGFHTCALSEDMKVYCWGGYVWCGATDNQFLSSPTRMTGDADVTAFGVGNDAACAVTQQGSILCWNWSRLPNGPRPAGWKTPACPMVHMTDERRGQIRNSTDMWVLSNHLCFRTGQQTTICEPLVRNDHSTPVIKWNDGSFADAHDISVGAGIDCGLFSGGTVRCFGYNSDGQLISDRWTAKLPDAPVEIRPAGSAADIDVGTQHTCIMDSDDTIRCWGGDNWGGELGRRAFKPIRLN